MLSLWVNFFKQLNIRQSYKQEHAWLSHALCMPGQHSAKNEEHFHCTLSVTMGRPWLGPFEVALRCVLHFRFCGWCYVFTNWPSIGHAEKAHVQSDLPGAASGAKSDVYDCTITLVRTARLLEARSYNNEHIFGNETDIEQLLENENTTEVSSSTASVRWIMAPNQFLPAFARRRLSGVSH